MPVKLPRLFHISVVIEKHRAFNPSRIFSHLLFVMFFASCHGNDKTQAITNFPAAGNDVSDKIPAAQTQTNNTDGDPTFVVAKDTVSAYGPHSITRNVLQDKNGNIWFATWEGIVKYDGKQFTNVTLKEGLKHYHIFSILEDRNSNLWFGTIGGGVFKYDPRLSGPAAFTLFTTADGLVNNSVMWMLEDRTGNAWFATTGGVSKYNGSTFTNFTKDQGLGDNFVSAIAEDNTGKLWFGTNGGVNCYDPSALNNPGGKIFSDFRISNNLSFHNVRSIVKGQHGIMWIGSEEGFFRCDPSSANTGSKPVINLASNSVSYIFEDKKGNLWLNGNEVNIPGMTMSVYDPHNIGGNEKGFTRIIAKTGNREPFFNQIFGGIEDRDGKIWFGTANGACRYDGKGKDGKALFNFFRENEMGQ